MFAGGSMRSMTPAERQVQKHQEFFFQHAVAIDEERAPRREHRVLMTHSNAVIQRPPADGSMNNVEIVSLKSEIRLRRHQMLPPSSIVEHR